MAEATPNGTKSIITSRSNWATWVPVVSLILANLGGGDAGDIEAHIQQGGGLLDQLWVWGVAAFATVMQVWSNLSPSGKRHTILGTLGSTAALLLAVGVGASLVAATGPAIADTGAAVVGPNVWQLVSVLALLATIGAIGWLRVSRPWQRRTR